MMFNSDVTIILILVLLVVFFRLSFPVDLQEGQRDYTIIDKFTSTLIEVLIIVTYILIGLFSIRLGYLLFFR